MSMYYKLVITIDIKIVKSIVRIDETFTLILSLINQDRETICELAVPAGNMIGESMPRQRGLAQTSKIPYMR